MRFTINGLNVDLDAPPMTRPIAVLGLLALTACSVPGAPTEDLRVMTFAATADHIRAFAPAGAPVYLHPTDSTKLDELRAMSDASNIPIGAREDVLVCPHGCYAAEGTVVLVRIQTIEFPSADSAEVELELVRYEPEYEVYAEANRIHLARTGGTWRIMRVDRMWET